MSKLVDEVINELKLQIFKEQEDDGKPIVVLYPGEFQPFALHHKLKYDWLVTKFGKERIHLITTDKVDKQGKPLSFAEKKAVIKKFGITQVVNVLMPYNVSNVVEKMELDPSKTILVYVVSEETKSKLKGIGKITSYNKTTHLPIKDVDNPYVYYVIPPEVELEIPGFGKMTDESVYKALADREAKLAELKMRFKSIMGWLDTSIFNGVISKFNTRRGKLREDLNDWFRFFSNMTQEQGSLFFNIIKKEYGDTKDLLPILQKFIKGGKLSQDEKTTFQNQMKDILKVMGLGSIAAIPIPGTMLLIPVIVQLAKRFNINLLPEVKEDTSLETLPIVKREFWNEVFIEVAKEDDKQQLDEVVVVPTELISKLETELIKLLIGFSKKIKPDMPLLKIYDAIIEFKSSTEAYFAGEKLSKLVANWVNGEETVKKYRRRTVISPGTMWGITFTPTYEIGPFPEIGGLLRYCTDKMEKCDSMSNEFDYILNDKIQSNYEKDNSTNYSKFYNELNKLGNFTQFTGNAELKTRDEADYIMCHLNLDIQFIPLCVLIALSKSGVIENKSVDAIITNFVKKDLTPSLVHEITHFAQMTRQKVKSGTVRPPSYAGMSGYDSKFWDTYLSDKMEIGAHANEFVINMRNSFPDKTDKELLQMLQYKKIPQGVSRPYDKYFDSFIRNVVDDKTDPAKQRFLKIIYQVLSQ